MASSSGNAEPIPRHGVQKCGFQAFRARDAERILSRLQAASASGPDLVPTRLLKEGEPLSSQMVLSNMVFQGTVWGPPLWNIYYEDAAASVQCFGFEEMVYADDFNARKCILVPCPMP